MIAVHTDSITWSADAAGMNLLLRTPDARKIAESVKPGKEYTAEIKEYRPKRSLDQNALYWSVLTKFADSVGISNNEAHNRMLRAYGQLERYDSNLVYVVLPDTDEAEAQANEAETYHVKPTSQVKEGRDGKMYRTYMLLRGSSTYNTSEFRRLLDGLLYECKQIGVDVLSDRERSLLYGQ
jgi:hypothetical protein